MEKVTVAHAYGYHECRDYVLVRDGKRVVNIRDIGTTRLDQYTLIFQDGSERRVSGNFKLTYAGIIPD